MPTPGWRHDKSAHLVRSLCRLLLTEPDEHQRIEIHISLHYALKLLCDSITAVTPKRGHLWTPGLANLFADQPKECERWLELLNEPDFKPDRA